MESHYELKYHSDKTTKIIDISSISKGDSIADVIARKHHKIMRNLDGTVTLGISKQEIIDNKIQLPIYQDITFHKNLLEELAVLLLEMKLESDKYDSLKKTNNE